MEEFEFELAELLEDFEDVSAEELIDALHLAVAHLVSELSA